MTRKGRSPRSRSASPVGHMTILDERDGKDVRLLVVKIRDDGNLVLGGHDRNLADSSGKVICFTTGLTDRS